VLEPVPEGFDAVPVPEGLLGLLASLDHDGLPGWVAEVEEDVVGLAGLLGGVPAPAVTVTVMYTV